MTQQKTYKLTALFIASVWLINGLFCKVLNLVPRHQEIVGRILESNYSRTITVLIGLSEIVMAIWILSNYKSKLNAIIQMGLIATMNIMEFLLADDLLLWGKLNSFFALVFIMIVYYTNFKIKNRYAIIS